MIKTFTAIQSIFFQGVAAVCTVLTTYYVSSKLGASGQGEWALLKSNVEFIAALMSFGFPVSYTYFINSRSASASELFKFYIKYLLFVLPVIFILLKINIIEIKSHNGVDVIFYSIVMAVLISLHLNIRGIILASYPLLIFNIVSFILPFSILIVFFIFGLDNYVDIVNSYLLACFIILLVSLLLLLKKNIKAGGKTKTKTKMIDFYIHSVWNFISNVGPYLYVIIINQWMLKNGFNYKDIGLISVMLLIQGAILLIPNVLGPLLYRVWSADDSKILSTYRKTLFYFVSISLVVIAIIYPLLDYVIPKILGKEFINSVILVKILMVSIPFSFAIRVLLNACLSIGAVKEYAIATNLKNLFILLTFVILVPSDLASIVAILAVYEMLTFISLALMSKRKFSCSLLFLLGLKKNAI
ncbi:hypothetical protein VAS14_06373 [Photobacterium angustum S14]|uniref:Polysaccharide biosynthesis protein C-terminal domain-containing protein n=1 Tax=Photobacterium angustum (strain S14 / CCUG 15956) TaxID=314292 RepID=Q1ZRK3_PHOAS|nr:hypothetical protein [Photobacterium angustum]EAS65324.1 hypothetical protein VAS14_06373 [Photobacterium angustum S14]